jgi:hypothetical protein
MGTFNHRDGDIDHTVFVWIKKTGDHSRTQLVANPQNGLRVIEQVINQYAQAKQVKGGGILYRLIQ